MFITDQLYLLKQSVSNPKTPDCNNEIVRVTVILNP